MEWLFVAMVLVAIWQMAWIDGQRVTIRHLRRDLDSRNAEIDRLKMYMKRHRTGGKI